MKDIHIILPKRWSDLNRDQLARISKLLLKFRDKPDFLVRCLLMFTGWKIVRWKMLVERSGNSYYFKNQAKDEFCISGDVFTELIKRIEWLTGDITLNSFSPSVPGYDSPNFMLYSTTLNQYLMADNYYRQFVEKVDFIALARMVVVLYCKDPEAIDVEKAGKELLKLEKSILYAVFIWFSGAKNWLREKYPFVFNVQGNEGNEYADEVILSLLSSLNGGDITRNKSILNTMVHEALFELNLKIETSQKK